VASLGPDDAEDLYALPLPYRDEWILLYTETPLGSAHLHLGRLARAAGRDADAVDHLQRALVVHDASGEVTICTHIALELAQVMSALGHPDVERIRALAGVAARCAAEIGIATALPTADDPSTPDRPGRARGGSS
jgi:hypothetical protein